MSVSLSIKEEAHPVINYVIFCYKYVHLHRHVMLLEFVSYNENILIAEYNFFTCSKYMSNIYIFS